ncbi:MAG TPA: NPCBM/NEW2 domain-containing protein [Candidatus Brocadiia bacterium]|nr:NPCBM/NEW2 domain-containing protein [Candidatus Brocadiia bacterium]
MSMARNARALALAFAVFAAVLAAPGDPLVKPGGWTHNECARQLRIGARDFWFTETGVWSRVNDEAMASLTQVGLAHRTIPGHNALANFVEGTGAAPVFRRLAQQYVENKWPFATVDYVVYHGNPNLTDKISAEVKALWIGDGHPEQSYRLEPVFFFLRSGQKWQGSSSYLWKDEYAVKFAKEKFLPRVREKLPFCEDPNHKWTRPELRQLSDIYMDAFWEGRMPLVWGMGLSPFHMATNFDIRAVGEKGATPFHAARGLGMLRQAGGDKMLCFWLGHEPTERHAYFKSGWYSTRGEEWGMPLQLLTYYFFRPYLIGGNMLSVEAFPGSAIQDIEDDGQYELSTVGHIGRAVLDFCDRHPDRGVPYSPIALLLDASRPIGAAGTTYFGYNLPFDDADHMNCGVIYDLLFPETRYTRFSGDYFGAAPLGENFDIISPNTPARKAFDRPKLLANYKVLFGLGGLEMDKAFAADLEDYVRKGGVLVVNAEDAQTLPESFLGVAIGEAAQMSGAVTRLDTGGRFEENAFTARQLALRGAETLYACGGAPVVTRHVVGQGAVIVCAPRYLIQNADVETCSTRLRKVWRQKPLLKLAEDLMKRLAEDALPVRVSFAGAEPNTTGWRLMKKGDGWVVSLFNYSLERDLIAETQGTAKVVDSHPPKAVDVTVTCRTPVQDVVEWNEDRDVNWKTEDGQAVIREKIRGGQVVVYELQPTPIPPGVVARPMNYALNKPVTASSFRPGFEPGLAVDGSRDNDGYWWSDLGKGQGRARVFETPQWLQVDLLRVREIDHVYVQFHVWPSQNLETRLSICKYYVEASEDGQKWQRILDETKNEDVSLERGLERWFKPVQARYVRLTVLKNSSWAGAQVVEFEVLGPKLKEYPIDRKSLTPRYEVQYPAWVKEAPADKQTWLIDLKPAQPAKTDFLYAGTTWEQNCGPIKLMTSARGEGRVYEKSIYAQANSEIVYCVPENARAFVSAIGLGTYCRDASMVFKVFLDDKLVFESPLYRLGMPVLPVVVETNGAKTLKLVVTDGGDGITNDYAWWAEARFLGK